MDQGRWKLNQIIKAFLRRSSGPVTVVELLEYLKGQGFHVAETGRVLDQFVDVDAKGRVTLREGG